MNIEELRSELARQEAVLEELEARAPEHVDTAGAIEPALDAWLEDRLRALRARPAPVAPRFAVRV